MQNITNALYFFHLFFLNDEADQSPPQNIYDYAPDTPKIPL